jgi:transcriptional regulator with XRE-family HTH domain
MKERIIEFLKVENKSSAQLAEEIGVQPSGISHILSGRNNPSLDFVLKMLDKYKFLSTDWLILGKGDMYRESQIQKLFDDSMVVKSEADSQKEVFKAELFQKENEIKKEQGQALKAKDKGRITRVVMFYSDNTFKEYLPDID